MSSVKANQSIDTSFNIEISEIGKFAIKAAVIDEDGQKSRICFASDSINVSSGVIGCGICQTGHMLDI